MTVEVRALSVGRAVPRLNFQGAVHSIFRNAANVRGAGEGLLLTLLLAGEADLPQGIRLDAPNGFAFEGLPVGTRAVCREGVLALGDTLRVDLRTASTWDCELSSLDADLTDPAVVSAWRHAWNALREERARSGPAMVMGGGSARTSAHRSVFEQRIDRVMHSVLEATANYDVVGMEDIGALVGLGTGLTPSGDDILTGYVAGLWCTVRRKPQRRAFLGAVANLVVRYSTRTNDIARTYLCLAARGQVSSRLVDLAAAICEGADRQRVLGAAEAAMRVGHTSGLESVYGLLLGLAAWDGA
jgi:hypothetical protein